MRCERCGKENDERSKFCTGCGTPMTKADLTNNAPSGNKNFNTEKINNSTQDVYGGQRGPQKVYVQNSVPESHTPISMWGYLGYEILFSIPCVGIICLIIFSLGGTSNVNVRNFARSYFCFVIILFVIFVALIMGGIILPVGLLSELYS